jgi:hypothetical protein
MIVWLSTMGRPEGLTSQEADRISGARNAIKKPTVNGDPTAGEKAAVSPVGTCLSVKLSVAPGATITDEGDTVPENRKSLMIAVVGLATQPPDPSAR